MAPRTRTRTRPTTPPNRVDPGWVHSATANGILRFTSEKVKDVTGEPLNVGTLAEWEPTDVETREPVELLSRIIAHLFHRIPFAKRVEKRLEGKELKSGLASDFFALLAQLYRRNKHLTPYVMAQVNEALKEVNAQKKNKGKTDEPAKMPGPDFDRETADPFLNQN